jgi:16S rRNA G966 N2-methylase RsmD
MNKNGINPVEWAHEIVRRAEAQWAFVAPTADLVFADPPFGIGQAGVYSLANPLN